MLMIELCVSVAARVDVLLMGPHDDQEAIDNDDGSCYYHTHHNFMSYSGNGMKVRWMLLLWRSLCNCARRCAVV